MVSCQVIKTEQPVEYLVTQAAVLTKNQGVPVMRDHYMKLHAIDSELSQKFYPINEAIRRAIHIVLQYYSYRDDLGVSLSNQ